MSSIVENLYIPAACNPCLVCPSTAVKPELLKCLSCKLVNYCSTEHQKLDWPIHKNFCKAVRSLMAEHKADHIIKINGPIKDKTDLCKVTVKIKYHLALLLKRPLVYHEEELTSFPIMCAVCFSTKPNLYQCKECNAVSYCCADHEKEDSKNHSKICLQLKLHYCKFKNGQYFEMNIEFKERCNLINSDLAKVMAIMYDVKFSADPTVCREEYQKYSFVSNFSSIATVCYITQFWRTHQLGKEFTLYVVGSTVDDMFFSQLHTKFFFDCFPEVDKLNGVFIGPNIPDELIKKNATYRVADGKLFNVKMFKGRIEQFYFSNKTEIKPHLVVCFNCGFSENPVTNGPSEAWYKGIQTLAERIEKTPIVFTSYTNMEAENDFKAFERAINHKKGYVFALEKIIERQLNPYRDLRPFRNWQYTDPERIFYRNGYIQALRISRRGFAF